MSADAPSAQRALWSATIGSVGAWAAHTTFMYYLAPVALRVAGIEDRDFVLFTLVAVAMGLTVLPAGHIADRIPRRYAMRIGLALLAAAYATLLIPLSLTGLAVGACLSGVGLGFHVVAFTSYVADLLAATERAAAYGRASSLSVLAMAAGPALAASVFRVAGAERFGLGVNAALFALLALGGLALTSTLPKMRAAPAPARPVAWGAIARAAAPAAATYLLMGAGYGMTSPYFTVYFLDALAVAPQTWGYVLAGGTLLSALGAQLAPRFRTAPLLIGAQGTLLVAHLAFLLPWAGVAFLALAFLVRSFCSSTTSPAISSATAERAPPGAHARTQALGSVAWNVGWASGALGGGAILAASGPLLFPVGGALAFLGALAGVALLRRR